MRFRFRLLAALLALLAFSASFAEGVWASTCAETGTPTAHAGMDMPTGDDHSPCDTASREEQGPKGDCPLPAMAASGCVVVSLPAVTVQLDISPAAASLVATVPAAFVDRLAVSALFRPPQQ